MVNDGEDGATIIMAIPFDQTIQNTKKGPFINHVDSFSYIFDLPCSPFLDHLQE